MDSGDALSEWQVLRGWAVHLLEWKGEKQDVTEDLISVVSVILSKFHVLLAFYYKI